MGKRRGSAVPQSSFSAMKWSRTIPADFPSPITLKRVPMPVIRSWVIDEADGNFESSSRRSCRRGRTSQSRRDVSDESCTCDRKSLTPELDMHLHTSLRNLRMTTGPGRASRTDSRSKYLYCPQARNLSYSGSQTARTASL